MKLLSGLNTLAVLALVALGIGPVFAAQPGPRATTAAALLCVLGEGPTECDTALRDRLLACGPNMDPARCRPFILYRADLVHAKRCNSPDGSLGRECPMGELESVQYLGAQKSGYDVYDVKFRNGEATFVFAAEPDGKIHFQRFSVAPSWVMPSSMVAITAPANPVQVLFRQQG